MRLTQCTRHRSSDGGHTHAWTHSLKPHRYRNLSLTSFYLVTTPPLLRNWNKYNTGFNYPLSQLFLENEKYVIPRKPTLDCTSPNRCVQHVTQRLDLSIPAISDKPKALNTSIPHVWNEFKIDFRQRFTKPSDYISLQLSDIFKLIPDSLTTNNLTSFCAKIRKALNGYLRALGDEPRFRSLYSTLQENHTSFKSLTAESVLYSAIQRKWLKLSFILMHNPTTTV